MTIKASGDGILTLSDQFYPGWYATIDGQPAEIIRSDTVFRSVCLPAGDHTVRFEYRPLSLYVGVGISVVGWLVLAAVTLVTFIRRPASPERDKIENVIVANGDGHEDGIEPVKDTAVTGKNIT